MSAQLLQSFVRSAWTLLQFQLVAAFAAVGVTAWAAFQVGPLFEQREELVKDVSLLSSQRESLDRVRMTLATENKAFSEDIARLSTQKEGLQREV